MAYAETFILDPNLHCRLQKQFELLWEKADGHADNQALFADLPRALHTEAMSSLNEDIIRTIPLFRECDDSFIRALSCHLKDVYYPPNAYILRKGDWG
jgi:hypothetical protein